MRAPSRFTRIALPTAILVCTVTTACGASDGAKLADATVAPPSVVTSVVTKTAPAPSATKHRQPAKLVAPKPAAAHSSTKKPKPARSKTAAAAAGSWVMPSLVGSGLQAAQDEVQRVSGDPVFFSHSHDLIRDRFQIFDRDWKVCTQNVAPGTRVSAVAHIDFGVVKLYETCP